MTKQCAVHVMFMVNSVKTLAARKKFAQEDEGLLS